MLQLLFRMPSVVQETLADLFLDGSCCAAGQQHDDAHDSARVGHRRRPLSLAREFPVSTQRANCVVIPAQPLESCVAIILPDARPSLGNLRLTHRGLTSCRSLADGLARCQLSSAGGVAARQIAERSPLHCWKRGRAKPTARGLTNLAEFLPFQVVI